jgi:hypothetical protein
VWPRTEPLDAARGKHLPEKERIARSLGGIAHSVARPARITLLISPSSLARRPSDHCLQPCKARKEHQDDRRIGGGVPRAVNQPSGGRPEENDDQDGDGDACQTRNPQGDEPEDFYDGRGNGSPRRIAPHDKLVCPLSWLLQLGQHRRDKQEGNGQPKNNDQHLPPSDTAHVGQSDDTRPWFAAP